MAAVAGANRAASVKQLNRPEAVRVPVATGRDEHRRPILMSDVCRRATEVRDLPRPLGFLRYATDQFQYAFFNLQAGVQAVIDWLDEQGHGIAAGRLIDCFGRDSEFLVVFVT